MNETRKKVLDLQAAGEDYEFFPTTQEILTCIKNDLLSYGKENYNYQCSYWGGSKLVKFKREFEDRQPVEVMEIDSFLDCGAGDGRVLEFFDMKPFRLSQKYGIEIARVQADDLIRRGVSLIGRDYFETVLIDKEFGVCFSNPPYSRFKEWCVKLLGEVNAALVYLVIPQRWKEDADFVKLMHEKGDVKILGEFDFLNADRAARAKVDVIVIRRRNDKENACDPFTTWVEANIGAFAESKPKMEEIQVEDIEIKSVEERDTDTATALVENYNRELQELLSAYRSIGGIDFRLLRRLGLEKKQIIDKIKTDIAALKNRYWRITLDSLKPINSRLTQKTREQFLDRIKWVESMDYNANNVLTLIVWVIENANKYSKEQMLQCYEDLTNFEGAKAYKSNERWVNDRWRYGKTGLPEKYSLDYRVVARCGYKIGEYEWKKYDNPIADLCIVGDSLGFKNNGAHDFVKDGQSKSVLMDNGKELFVYRCYQNNNVHFKLNKEFLMAFNVAVGMEKGWLKAPADIQSEFEVSEAEAVRFFEKSPLRLYGVNRPLLIGLSL
jgi:hypothetical protein